MRAVTNDKGEIPIIMRHGGDVLSFNLIQIDSKLLPPNTEVEVPRDELLALCDAVGAPLGFSREDLLWEQPPASGTAVPSNARPTSKSRLA